METGTETLERFNDSCLHYLNLKIPDVPEVTRLEIAGFFAGQLAAAELDMMRGLNRQYSKASKRDLIDRMNKLNEYRKERVPDKYERR